jgi:hypothetical protein
MKKCALGMALFCLLVGIANAQSPYQPDLVNNLIVYDEALAPSCEPDRVFLLRTSLNSYCSPFEPTYPPRTDACLRYFENPPVKMQDYCGRWVGGVMGVYWPADEDNATFLTRPYPQAMDGPEPADPCEPPISSVKFVEGTGQFKNKSFSYFVYDMTDKRGCQVRSATLRFKASPWYSEAAQNGNFTAFIGVFDMAHRCENLTQDEKRDCFEALASDPVNNPFHFTFPLNPAEFPAENHDDCPGHPPNNYKPYSVNVTQSVQADLNDAGASGFVGFMIGSRGFGANDIDAQPGMRNVGMTDFVLEVELGPCGGSPTGVPATSHWGMLVFALTLIGAFFWMLRKRRASH